MQLQGGAGTACDSPTNPAKCGAAAGGGFTLNVAVTNFPAGGYTSISGDVTLGALTIKQTNDPATEIVWPGASVPVHAYPAANHWQGGALSAGLGATPSMFKGVVIALSVNCTAGSSSNTVNLIPYDAVGNPLGAAIGDTAQNTIPQSDSITVNCTVAPSATPSLTPTRTPTITNTPTPVRRMQKLPALSNVFLTRQGTKIPPARCLVSSNFAGIAEEISAPVTGPDPKDPSQPRQLGGFSFQVKYDPLKVCIDLTPGPAWTQNPQQVCTVEDSVSAPALQGVARINCVTLGKATVIDTRNQAGRTLAAVYVRPQPELYSQIIPNQDNGQAVQLNAEACKLTDLQGHPIEVFSCEDTDVTVRFLEGDVEPDCQVNSLDTQAIAFRWGATKGIQLYTDRMNLEPAIPRDQDIDVNDLQFVYGRFGSTCYAPWPPQPPVNPKS